VSQAEGLGSAARCRRADGRLNLLVDSTGIKSLGYGEWQTRKHDVQRRRQWSKEHLALDPAKSDIRAVEFTRSHDGNSPVLLDLLDQISARKTIGCITADGAHDTFRAHTATTEGQVPRLSPQERTAMEG
jgi:hypothetical protein